jgi:hypothetical protein
MTGLNKPTGLAVLADQRVAQIRLTYPAVSAAEPTPIQRIPAPDVSEIMQLLRQHSALSIQLAVAGSADWHDMIKTHLPAEVRVRQVSLTTLIQTHAALLNQPVVYAGARLIASEAALVAACPAYDELTQILFNSTAAVKAAAQPAEERFSAVGYGVNTAAAVAGGAQRVQIEALRQTLKHSGVRAALVVGPLTRWAQAMGIPSDAQLHWGSDELLMRWLSEAGA